MFLIFHFCIWILIKLLLEHLNILYSAVFCFCYKLCFRLIQLVLTYWNVFCVWQNICGIWSSERRRVFSIEKCRQPRWEGQPHYSPSGPHVPASPLDLKRRRTFRWWEWNSYTCYTQVRHALKNEDSRPGAFPKRYAIIFSMKHNRRISKESSHSSLFYVLNKYLFYLFIFVSYQQLCNVWKSATAKIIAYRCGTT